MRTYGDGDGSDAALARVEKAAEKLATCSPETAMALLEELDEGPAIVEPEQVVPSMSLPAELEDDAEAACKNLIVLFEKLEDDEVPDMAQCMSEMGPLAAECGDGAEAAFQCMAAMQGDDRETVAEAMFECAAKCM